MLKLTSFLMSMQIPAIRALVYLCAMALSFKTGHYVLNILRKDCENHEKDL